MRVWDIHPKHLCRKHLLAEHRELHGLWNILTKHGGKVMGNVDDSPYGRIAALTDPFGAVFKIVQPPAG